MQIFPRFALEKIVDAPVHVVGAAGHAQNLLAAVAGFGPHRAALTGAIEVILIFVLLPGSNYLVGTAIFSAYLAVSVIWNVLRGLTLIKREEAAS